MYVQVYIIDFGLAKKYRDTTTHQHIPYRYGDIHVIYDWDLLMISFGNVGIGKNIFSERKWNRCFMCVVVPYLAFGFCVLPGPKALIVQPKYQKLLLLVDELWHSCPGRCTKGRNRNILKRTMQGRKRDNFFSIEWNQVTNLVRKASALVEIRIWVKVMYDCHGWVHAEDICMKFLTCQVHEMDCYIVRYKNQCTVEEGISSVL